MSNRIRLLVQSPLFPWIVYGLLLEISFVSLAWVSTQPRPLFPFLLTLSFSFGVYFLSVRKILQWESENHSLLKLILIFSALFHLTLLPTLPILDDDIYRYIWDGRVFSGSLNPYYYPPESWVLTDFRDTVIYPRIGYKFIPTIYPPFAQVLFVFSQYLPFGEFHSLKILLVLFNAASITFLILLLSALGRSPARVLIFAWNPLVLKELVNSAHLDSILIALFLGALWLAVSQRKTVSALFYSFAVLTKFVPLIWFPFFFRGWKIRQVFLVGAVLVLAYLPFVWSDPLDTFTGLRFFAMHWEFNAGPFFVIQSAISFLFENGELYSKLLVGFIVSCFVFLRFRKGSPNGEGLLINCYLVLGLFLLLLPTVNPWYVCWMVPFLCLFPNPAWLAFTALVNLSYVFYLNEEPIREIQFFEYFVFIILLIRFSWPRLKSLRKSPI